MFLATFRMAILQLTLLVVLFIPNINFGPMSQVRYHAGEQLRILPLCCLSLSCFFVSLFLSVWVTSLLVSLSLCHSCLFVVCVVLAVLLYLRISDFVAPCLDIGLV